MCGRKRHHRLHEYGESYEGETTRLRGLTAGRSAGNPWHSFPWWTLWLIWPLVGVLKGAGGALLAGWSTLGMFAVPLNMLLAVGLIVVGVALLVRQNKH